jgi:hypothetical protein
MKLCAHSEGRKEATGISQCRKSFGLQAAPLTTIGKHKRQSRIQHSDLIVLHEQFVILRCGNQRIAFPWPATGISRIAGSVQA